MLDLVKPEEEEKMGLGMAEFEEFKSFCSCFLHGRSLEFPPFFFDGSHGKLPVMNVEPIDELANYLEKLEIRHKELAKQHEFLEKTVHTMTDIVEKDIEALVQATKHHRELINELQSDLHYMDLQQDQLVESFSVHREQTTRVLKMQERLQEASLVNVRTHEQKQLTAMVVHLMEKVDEILKKHEDIQSVSDSEDTFGVLRRAIRWQHTHDKALDAKSGKKSLMGKKVFSENAIGVEKRQRRSADRVKIRSC